MKTVIEVKGQRWGGKKYQLLYSCDLDLPLVCFRLMRPHVPNGVDTSTLSNIYFIEGGGAVEIGRVVDSDERG